MSSFFVVCYSISLILSVITLITGIFVGINRLYTIRILPKAIRLYLMTCCFPYFFLTSICSISTSIFYLLYNSEKYLTIDILRNIVTFSAQQIRTTCVIIIFERIVVTVKLETYTFADDKNKLFWILTVFSYSTSSLFVAYFIYAKSRSDIPLLYNTVHYGAYSAHMIMLFGAAILYLMNKRMYKVSAYRITLKRRHTIARNIKSLRYLFPKFLIYALFAQFGSMISIIFQAFSLPTPPVGIFHIFFNLSFILIYFQHYCIHSDKILTIKNNVTTVTNPLGKNIPTIVTTDQYFRDLQNQWLSKKI